ncbi:MAG: hypothetical protein ACO22T_05990 [Burkholderiales bacterium]
MNSFIFKHPSRFFLVSLPTVRRFPVFSVRVTAVMAAIWHSLPMLFYKMDIGPQLCFGFAVNVTFDLSAEFSPCLAGPDSRARFFNQVHQT